MKSLRSLIPVLAAAVICCWAVATTACDQDKGASTSSASNSCTHGASAVTASMPGKAAHGSCSAHGASATTASMNGSMCAGKNAATAAGYGSCSAHATTASAKGEGVCPYHNGASATTASMGGTCSEKNAATAAGYGSCSAHGASAVTASAKGEGVCPYHNGANMTTAAGSSCPGHGVSTMAKGGDGCTYCQELQACDQEMRSLGAVAQVVSLRNGVMFVYTADAAKVRNVQSAMARRKEQMALFAGTGDDAHLCSNCKTLRGAAASGKLTREVVNINGGCETLMTSTDPAIVAKIHELAGVTSTRVKS